MNRSGYSRLLPLIILVLFSLNSYSQKMVPEEFCLSNDELNLFDRLNQLRKDYDKDAVQLSVCLSYVAEVHVTDLEVNGPDTSICNSSSWSDKGEWTPCCYNSYVYNPDCMWDKPKELTPYRYRGYEMVTFLEEGFNNDSIINLWADSKEVLDMILTQGNYSKKKWICGGLSIGKNYVSLWFGQRRDVLQSPEICADEERVEDTINSIIVNNPTAYYLIFGSFPDMHAAKEQLRRIVADGFENAEILQGNNRIRLYLNKYATLKEAMFAKQQLPYKYREAWILKD